MSLKTVRQLIYLAPVNLNSPAQRPHHFVSWAHAALGCDVIWIDPNPARLPRWGDWRRLVGQPTLPLGPAWTAEPWLKRIKLNSLPFEPLSVGRFANRWMQSRAIREIKAWLCQEDCWLVVGRPSGVAWQLCREVKGRRVLYDVMDDTPEFSSGSSSFWMHRMHQALANSAEHLWCSAKRLQLQLLAASGRHATLVRNGTMVPSVQAEQLPCPPWILGYIGTLASWFDWEWVVRLATTLPHVELRLYGPLTEGLPKDLPRNVRYLGPVCHDEVFGLMAQWHAGLIPFKINNLTNSVDPVKYYEYRAVGLPVLSTRFGDMDQHQGDGAVWFLEDLAISALPEMLTQWSQKSLDERIVISSVWADNFRLGARTVGWRTKDLSGVQSSP